jgi:class III poly(R)-hydroxyalkanoic acid synthase PhaE subunit
MTGKSSFDPSDWTTMWADAQQKYWQSWLDLSRKTAENLGGKPPEPPNPWAQSFDFWAKLMPGAAPAESRDWIGKLVDMNKGYLQMGEGLWKMLSAGQSQPQTAEGWWDAVNRGFKEMQERFAGQVGDGKDPWAGFATFWGMPLDNWRRVCSACSIMPGDMEKALRGFAVPGVADAPENPVMRLLSMPTLGYTREGQEEVQRWGQLWLEHGQAMREYSTEVLSKVTAKASELLTARLGELAAQGKTPDTLRDFYNLWVDCGEEAYAAEASTPEFTRAQARLVNTLMAVKRQEQKMVDKLLSGLNMPTRRELDTSHKRTHQLQRQVWKMREELEEADVAALRDEVAALKREVEALRAESEGAKSEKRAARAAKPSA